jgi:maltose/moltooligosaccharide transporter
MMIVFPMLLFALTLPLIYGGEPAKVFGLVTIPTMADLLHGDPRNVLTLSGVMLIAAAASVLWVREGYMSRTANLGNDQGPKFNDGRQLSEL